MNDLFNYICCCSWCKKKNSKRNQSNIADQGEKLLTKPKEVISKDTSQSISNTTTPIDQKEKQSNSIKPPLPDIVIPPFDQQFVYTTF